MGDTSDTVIRHTVQIHPNRSPGTPAKAHFPQKIVHTDSHIMHQHNGYKYSWAYLVTEPPTANY